MAANLNNYYGIDFGTTSSAVVGYMVMDHKPEQFLYGDDEGRPIDYTKPAHTNFVVKAKFYAVRMMQTGLGKKDPEYTDYKYWKEQGWIDTVRPWQ